MCPRLLSSILAWCSALQLNKRLPARKNHPYIPGWAQEGVPPLTQPDQDRVLNLFTTLRRRVFLLYEEQRQPHTPPPPFAQPIPAAPRTPHRTAFLKERLVRSGTTKTHIEKRRPALHPHVRCSPFPPVPLFPPLPASCTTSSFIHSPPPPTHLAPHIQSISPPIFLPHLAYTIFLVLTITPVPSLCTTRPRSCCPPCQPRRPSYLRSVKKYTQA